MAKLDKKLSGKRAKERIEAAIAEWEKETGRNFYRGLVEMAGDSMDGRQVALPAYRAIIEALTKGESTAEIDVTRRDSPSIYLPEEKPEGAPGRPPQH